MNLLSRNLPDNKNDYRLPDGWTLVTVKDLSKKIQYGYTAKANIKPIGPKLLRITDIQNNRVDWDKVPHCKIDENDLEKYQLKPKDILFARTGATVGKSYMIDKEVPNAIFASYLIRIQLHETLEQKYLYYFFQSLDYWYQIQENKIGIGQPNVNGEKLSKIILALPPLNEQNRIVSRLEELFSKLDAGIEYLKKTQILLNQYRHSVLKYAFEGKLTTMSSLENPMIPVDDHVVEEYKKSNNSHYLPPGWINVRIEDLALSSKGSIRMGPFGSQLKKHELIPNGEVRVLVIEDVINKLKKPSEKYISSNKYEKLEGFTVNPNDVLVTMMGTIGRSCVVPSGFERSIISSHLLRISPNTKSIDPNYLSYVIAEDVLTFRHMESQSRGIIMKGLNTSIIKNTSIRLPPLIIQERIVHILDSVLYNIKYLDNFIKENIIRINLFRNSILKYAFEGKLVHQNSADEPALKLLEKIKQAKSHNPVQTSKLNGRQTKLL